MPFLRNEPKLANSTPTVCKDEPQPLPYFTVTARLLRPPRDRWVNFENTNPMAETVRYSIVKDLAAAARSAFKREGAGRNDRLSWFENSARLGRA